MGIGTDPLGCQTGATMAPPTVRDFPYLIKAGATMRIANVRVRLFGTISGDGPKIRGIQADGFGVDETELTPVGDEIYEANDLDVTTAFSANLTAFYDTLDIDWEVSLDGTSWESAGTSRNPVYVALDDSEWPETIFQTVANLACSNTGATDPTSALAKTWALFSTAGGPANPKTVDGRDLYYYQPGFTALDNKYNGQVTVEGLLRLGRGQCGAWARLLEAALLCNGVTSVYVTATLTGPGADYFWVGQWDDVTDGSPFWFQSSAFDMLPTPNGNPLVQAGRYDDPSNRQYFLNKLTFKGQGTGGSATLCPAQKVFTNHQFLCVGGTYYDPSYGVTYTGAGNFQQKLAGYGADNGLINNKRTLTFKEFSGTIIQFSATCT